MWMLPLYLHVNQKSDYKYISDFSLLGNREKFAVSREKCFRMEDTRQKHGYIISSYEPLADLFFLYFNIRPNNQKKKKNAARIFFVNL